VPTLASTTVVLLQTFKEFCANTAKLKSLLIKSGSISDNEEEINGASETTLEPIIAEVTREITPLMSTFSNRALYYLALSFVSIP